MKVFVLSKARPIGEKKPIGIYFKKDLAEKTIRSTYPNRWSKDEWSGSYTVKGELPNGEPLLLFIDEVEVLERHGLPDGKLI